MKQPISPCLGCTAETGRSAEPNCHMTCKPYLAFNEECKALHKEKLRIAEEYRIQKEIEQRRIKLASEGRFYRKRKK